VFLGEIMTRDLFMATKVKEYLTRGFEKIEDSLGVVKINWNKDAKLQEIQRDLESKIEVTATIIEQLQFVLDGISESKRKERGARIEGQNCLSLENPSVEHEKLVEAIDAVIYDFCTDPKLIRQFVQFYKDANPNPTQPNHKKGLNPKSVELSGTPLDNILEAQGFDPEAYERYKISRSSSTSEKSQDSSAQAVSKQSLLNKIRDWEELALRLSSLDAFDDFIWGMRELHSSEDELTETERELLSYLELADGEDA
jgi:hypothetical protein